MQLADPAATLLRTRFYRALKDARLGHLREKEDRFVFHDLRHTFGTLAVRAFPLSDVKAFMGHESIETTHIYVEADLATKKQALERIAPANSSVRRFKADDTLLAFLASL